MSNGMSVPLKIVRFIIFLVSIALVSFGLANRSAYSEESTSHLDGSKAGGAPLVIVSIKPVHSLVAGIMKGAGNPVLLLKGASSPHSFQLKPSDAVMIDKADLIVRVGPSLEVSLNKVFSSLSKPSKVIDLLSLNGIELHHVRTPHHHDEEVEHNGEVHTEVEHEAEAIDAHMWLSLNNAKQIVLQVSKRLIQMNPSNGSLYERNTDEVLRKLKALKNEIDKEIQPLSGKGYMVFHDAYQYYTAPYGLVFAGAITLNPSTPPSAKHLKGLRDELAHEKVACVFAEPQYSDKILTALTEGSDVKTSILDPIGVDIDAGEDAYFIMMRHMTTALTVCLR